MWTQEAQDLAEAAWRGGANGTEVAAKLKSELGIIKTRRAVIGRLWRTIGAGQQPRNLTTTSRSPRTPRPARISDKPIRSRKVAQYVDPPAPCAPLNIPFLERRPNQCAAITDATRFAQRCCGHPVALGSVYCAAHVAAHHVPSKKERAK